MTGTEDLTLEEFQRLFHERFPNHVLVNYGGSRFDYIAGNLQTAVANEIIDMLEAWAHTLKEASEIPRFKNKIEARDWEVAHAHTLELISEVRQYRTRGTKGPHPITEDLPTIKE